MRRLACTLTLVVLLAGCSGDADAPSPESFRPGTCQAVAPDVIALGKDARRLGDDGVVEQEVKDSLREAQTRLSDVTETAERELQPVLTKLVTTAGLVRLRADGNTYEPALGKQLRRDYEAVVTACTAG